jgi:chromosome segregation ATPase
LYDEVLADLYAIQALLQRLEASAAALSQENEAYASKQHALVTAIDAAEADIVEQKKQLQEARAERDRLIEYEKVRKRIADFPARSSTKLEITFVEKEISDLEKQMKEMDVIIGQRESHFGGVVSMLSQVFCHHQEYCGDASPHQYESVDMKMGVAARETEDGEDAQGEITDEQNEEAPLPMVVDM